MPIDISGINSAQFMTSTSKSNSQNSGITMNDFMQLIVAQMKNQDMNSTQDNGAFMAQMAQMASMQAMQELTAVFKSSMAVNYVGKFARAEATVAINSIDPVTGGSVITGYERVAREGIVERVGFDGGDTMILVDNVWFKLEDLYEVHNEAPKQGSTAQENSGPDNESILNKVVEGYGD